MAEQTPQQPEYSQTALTKVERTLVQPGFAFLPKTYTELLGYAKEICNTDFVPKAMRGSPGAVLAAWQTGNEVGLPPMASLASIAIINGRPSIHSDGYWALVINHPMCEWFKETPPDEAARQGYGECTIKRRGNPHEVTRRFSKEEAESAGLLGKDNWKNYYGDMLQNRARHRAGTDAIPEATIGVLPSDVARDLPPLEMEIQKEPPISLPQPKPKPETLDEFKARQAEKAAPKEKKDAKPTAGSGAAKVVAEVIPPQPTDGLQPGSDEGNTTGADAGGADARKDTPPDSSSQPEEEPKEEKAGSAAAEKPPLQRDRFGRIAKTGDVVVDTSTEFKEKLIAWIHDATTEDLLAGSTDPRGGKDPSKCYLRTIFNDKEHIKKLTNEDRTAVLNEYDKERRQRP